MCRILIVDDHLETCRVMAMIVKHLGYEGHAISNSKEAIDFLDGNPPDLVLLDIMMPGVSGLEMLRRIRENPRTCNTPVVMMTAITDPATQQQAMNLGANDYWIKASFDLPELSRRIRMIVSPPQPPDASDGSNRNQHARAGFRAEQVETRTTTETVYAARSCRADSVTRERTYFGWDPAIWRVAFWPSLLKKSLTC